MTAAAIAFAASKEKEYTATAELLFRDAGFDQKLFGSSILSPSEDPAREAATNVKLASLDVVSARAAQRLSLPRTETADIREKVEVTSQGQSDVVAIAATDTDPAVAAKIANTVASEYIDFRREADRGKIVEALRLVRRQLDALTPAQRFGERGRSITARSEQLQILASLQTGNAELVQPAPLPKDPSSPKPIRSGILGLTFGLLFATAAVALLDRLDGRPRDASEVEAIFGRPVLAVVPDSRALQGNDFGAVQRPGPDGDAFRTMRTNLQYFNVDRDITSLLVTSSAPGDGKSTVSRHLAAVAATGGARTLLIEADLRRPTLHNQFDHLFERGLSNVLTGQSDVADVVQQLPLRAGPATSSADLDIIVAGAIPPNPADLLASERMRDLLVQLERRYDFIVIDSTPLIIVPDAIPLASLVSGVIAVVREGRSTRADMSDLRKRLDNLDVSPLGIAINGAKGLELRYGYYGGPNDAAPTPSADRSRTSHAGGASEPPLVREGRG